MCILKTWEGVRVCLYTFQDGAFRRTGLDIINPKDLPDALVNDNGRKYTMNIGIGGDIANENDLRLYSKVVEDRFRYHFNNLEQGTRRDGYNIETYIGSLKHPDIREDTEFNLTILRILMIYLNPFICQSDLGKAFIIENENNFLKKYIVESLKLADLLEMGKAVRYLLGLSKSHRIIRKDYEAVKNHDIKGWDIVRYWANGYKLNFKTIDHIEDYDVFMSAIGNNMGVMIEEIKEGSYLTDNILRSCTKLKILNVDSNPFVTDLSPFSDTLKELHCGGRSSIDQRHIESCRSLERLYVNNNPNINICPYGIRTLHANGNCGISQRSIMKCRGLIELSIVGNYDIIRLPATVTKLCVDVDSEVCKPENMGQLKHLELFITGRSNIRVPSKPFEIDSLETLIVRLEDIDPDSFANTVALNGIINIERNSNLKKLICPIILTIRICSKLPHLEYIDVYAIEDIRYITSASTVKVIKINTNIINIETIPRRYDLHGVNPDIIACIDDTRITNCFDFGGFKQLHTLSVMGTRKRTYREAPKIITKLPSSIEKIRIYDSRDHYDPNIKGMITHIEDNIVYSGRYHAVTHLSTDILYGAISNNMIYVSIVELSANCGNLPNLKTLSFHYIQGGNPPDINGILASFPNLTELNIRDNGDTYGGFSMSCKSIPLLRKLDIRRGEVIIEDLNELNKLEKLIIMYATIKDFSGEYMIPNPILRILILAHRDEYPIVDKLLIESPWLEIIAVRGVNHLIISPYVVSVDAVECESVTSTDPIGFKCLAEYRGSAYIKCESTKTLHELFTDQKFYELYQNLPERCRTNLGIPSDKDRLVDGIPSLVDKAIKIYDNDW